MLHLVENDDELLSKKSHEFCRWIGLKLFPILQWALRVLSLLVAKIWPWFVVSEMMRHLRNLVPIPLTKVKAPALLIRRAKFWATRKCCKIFYQRRLSVIVFDPAIKYLKVLILVMHRRGCKWYKSLTIPEKKQLQTSNGTNGLIEALKRSTSPEHYLTLLNIPSNLALECKSWCNGVDTLYETLNYTHMVNNEYVNFCHNDEHEKIFRNYYFLRNSISTWILHKTQYR